GIGLTIDQVMSNDGRVVGQRLRFASEDGHDHTLALDLLQHLSPAGREFLFPGEPAFAAFADETGPGQIAPGTASILSRVAGASDPDPSKAQVAISYAVAPLTERFYHYPTERSTFTMGYQIT